MHPAVVVDWGPLHLAVSAYRLALIGAALVAVAGTALVAIRRGAAVRRSVATVTAGAAGALIGARLLGAVNSGTSMLDPSFGAFSVWGALGGGILGGGLAWRVWLRSLLPAGVLLDAAAVPAGLAIGVARTGCLCAGCCFGLPTHLPWGLTYPSGSNAHIASLDSSNLLGRLFSVPPPVHPVPVYDGAAAVAAAGMAWWVHRRFVRTGRLRSGSSGAVFVGVYATARAAIELVRYHPPDPGLLSAAGWQLVFVTIVVASVLWVWRGSATGLQSL
jgi:phosphatidylglycerol:prolipoprotein diacylglycerol transferase